MPDLLIAIGREAEKGLPHEQDRRDDALANLAFYRGEFAQWGTVVQPGNYENPPIKRSIPFSQRTINVLSMHLYATGPAREFPENDDLTAWLQAQYARCGVNAKLQEADRLALAADAAAIQVIGTGDPDRPVRFLLYPADQFAVWADPVEPATPIVVATIDIYDEQRRIRLWTDEVVWEYRTAKLEEGQTAGGTAYTFVGEEENTYGVIPFAFVHCKPPSTQFWSNGPGTLLREANDAINFSLTDGGDTLRYAGKPITTAFNLADGCKPPSPYRPGDVWPLKADPSSALAGVAPSVDTLSPDLGFVDAMWADVQGFADLMLECHGIPPAVIRMVASGGRSGVSIVAEQMPVILWAMGRKSEFACYERDLARVTIAVGAAELARLGRPDATLDPAAADSLTLRWPSLVPDVPLVGAARAQQDALDLAMGKVSRAQLLMRDMNITHEQALAHLAAVAADLKAEEAMGLPPIPAPSNPGASTDAQD